MLGQFCPLESCDVLVKVMFYIYVECRQGLGLGGPTWPARLARPCLNYKQIRQLLLLVLDTTLLIFLQISSLGILAAFHRPKEYGRHFFRFKSTKTLSNFVTIDHTNEVFRFVCCNRSCTLQDITTSPFVVSKSRRGGGGGRTKSNKDEKSFCRLLFNREAILHRTDVFVHIV